MGKTKNLAEKPVSNIAGVSGSALYIVIESLYFWSDWTDTKKHTINLNEIIGFILHWRGDSWHVEVVTKIKKGEYDYESYELSHCVMPKQIAELIANKDVRILSFKNYNTTNFIQHLTKALDWAKSLS
jgi:hypothetical protein